MPVGPDYRPAPMHPQLPEALYAPVEPAVFPAHELRFFNRRAAGDVGLASLDDGELVRHFGRFEPLPENLERPLALAYHGHQFRAYNPDLGDGRGFLYAQLRARMDPRLLDLGTKGSGRTPWSRGADGRLTLKGGVRELLASEMLDALGVETSRTFCLIETGERLRRDDEPSPARSCVLTRLSHSHIRIGTFQRLGFVDDRSSLIALLDHAVEYYLPEARRERLDERAAAFLEAVCARVARVGAQWLAAGFVHGVLNTDNINITGESFDYGPWRFLPTLDPGFTAAYFDQAGLYAFGRQPDALLWNLTRLGECLLPLAPQQRLERALSSFEPAFHEAFVQRVLARFGLAASGTDSDTDLAVALWRFMRESGVAFEQVFFDWYGGDTTGERTRRSPLAADYARETFRPVRAAIEAHGPDARANPDARHFRREAPLTLLLEDVETIWQAIAEDDDWTPLEATLDAITDLRETRVSNTPPAKLLP